MIFYCAASIFGYFAEYLLFILNSFLFVDYLSENWSNYLPKHGNEHCSTQALDTKGNYDLLNYDERKTVDWFFLSSGRFVPPYL